MIKVNGIDHININVKSLDKAKKFYQKYFGFEVQEDYKYDNSTGGKTRFMLIGLSQKAMLCLYEDKDVNSDIEHSPLSHIGIHVENFNEALEIAQNNNFLNKKWKLIDYKMSRSFYIIDPNGLEIEISERFAGGH